MNKFITVHDSFLDNNGKLILGGVNHSLDVLSKDDIISHKNRELFLKSPLSEKSIRLQVIDINVTQSMWDKKNIFLLIGNKLKPIDVPSGSIIYER